ncbi:BrnT family toxin [Acidiferrobacter thiooxydans]|uniref:BrnT family toxin n=1 Tax=Acidiferrobacter thiooxydans TaxID=163359 RepID=UPI000A8A3A1E|nr:BrnT family toxin [Acidiferrobacter thiooxydans]UEO01039.1 BrnT family toxin [Acidiferrobacter thiooxydans]
MKVETTLYGVRFEWDAEKATANLRKHGVSFEIAREAFFDPFVRVVEASGENERAMR